MAGDAMTATWAAFPACSESIGALALALAGAQNEIKAAARGAHNPFFGGRYADLEAIMNACRAPLAAAGLAVLQPLEHDSDGRLWLTTVLLHGESGQHVASRIQVRVPPRDRKRNRDGTEEEIQVTPSDEQAAEQVQARRPQVIGSAITYYRRYALAALVGVVAEGEDDDAEAAHGRRQRQDGKPAGAPSWKAVRAMPCPACQKVGALRDSKPEHGGGYFCGKRDGGCGASLDWRDSALMLRQAATPGPGAPAPNTTVPAECPHCHKAADHFRALDVAGEVVCDPAKGGCGKCVAKIAKAKE